MTALGRALFDNFELLVGVKTRAGDFLLQQRTLRALAVRLLLQWLYLELCAQGALVPRRQRGPLHVSSLAARAPLLFNSAILLSGKRRAAQHASR